MKRAAVFYLLVFCVLSAFNPIQSDNIGFYKALSSDDEAILDKTLSNLEKESPSSKINAYKGVLTMKKAGFVKGVGGKLKTFKRGVQLLDNEISKNPNNAEYRFLRLTIQENAPGILNYNKQVDEDREAVVSGFKKLNPELKSFIVDYAKRSKVLKESDLK